jgi:hypothetical protein
MVKIGDKILVKDKDLKGRTFTVISTDGKTAYIQDVHNFERWTVSVKIIR